MIYTRTHTVNRFGAMVFLSPGVKTKEGEREEGKKEGFTDHHMLIDAKDCTKLMI